MSVDINTTSLAAAEKSIEKRMTHPVEKRESARDAMVDAVTAMPDDQATEFLRKQFESGFSLRWQLSGGKNLATLALDKNKPKTAALIAELLACEALLAIKGKMPKSDIPLDRSNRVLLLGMGGAEITDGIINA